MHGCEQGQASRKKQENDKKKKNATIHNQLNLLTDSSTLLFP